MITNDEITITKYETEFVAKHKDFDVIGVGGNEFEAVLELSKALGALMFSKETEHKALKQDVDIYKETLNSIKNICNEPSPSWILSLAEISKRYIEIDNLVNTYDEKLRNAG